MAERHCVFLVHGTWGYVTDEDRKDAAPWYEPGSKFGVALLEGLRSTSPECDWEIRSHTWPLCENIHAHRDAAAASLARTIEEFRKKEPNTILHFVAHSHGGNVVLDALSRWFTRLHSTGYDAFSVALRQMKKARQRASVDKDPFKDPPTPSELVGLVQDALRRSDLPDLTSAASLQEACGAVSKDRLGRWDLLRTWQIEALGNDIELDHLRIPQWSRIGAACWTAQSQVHGIGRLVFLGTPFLHKSWKSNHNRLSRRVAKFGQVTIAVIQTCILLYLSGLLLGMISDFFRGRVSFWNPIEWPWWVIGIVAFFAAANWSALLEVLRSPERHDTNVYFDLGRSELRGLAQAMGSDKRLRLRCLVVSAELFDEAFLALSAEPVLVGALKPQIRKWLRLEPPGAGAPDEAETTLYSERGIDWWVARHRFGLGTVLVKVIRLPGTVLARLSRFLWRQSLGPLVERVVMSVMRSVIQLIATGLHPQEMRHGREIALASRIGVPAVFEEGEPWDVTPIALAIPAFRGSARESERFAFLKGTPLPKGAADNHFLFGSLHAQGVTNAETLKIALMVDERVREAVGAVQLAHSVYYGNEEVIRRAAKFVSADGVTEGGRTVDSTSGQARDSDSALS
jgi:hypothetical protein